MMLLCALYWHWRIYFLYRSLSDVSRKFPCTEFYFQFHTPRLAAWLGGPMFRDGLSPEQQTQVAAVERQVRRVIVVIAVFGYICFFTFVGAFAWGLVRRGA